MSITSWMARKACSTWEEMADVAELPLASASVATEVDEELLLISVMVELESKAIPTLEIKIFLIIIKHHSRLKTGVQTLLIHFLSNQREIVSKHRLMRLESKINKQIVVPKIL